MKRQQRSYKAGFGAQLVSQGAKMLPGAFSGGFLPLLYPLSRFLQKPTAGRTGTYFDALGQLRVIPLHLPVLGDQRIFVAALAPGSVLCVWQFTALTCGSLWGHLAWPGCRRLGWQCWG